MASSVRCGMEVEAVEHKVTPLLHHPTCRCRTGVDAHFIFDICMNELGALGDGRKQVATYPSMCTN